MLSGKGVARNKSTKKELTLMKKIRFKFVG